MHCRRYSIDRGPCRTVRDGFLYVGALREILVVSLLGAIAFAMICQTNTVLQQHFVSTKSATLNPESSPVLRLALDEDRKTLLVHSWGKKLEEISLDDCRVSNKENPAEFVSLETSEISSTTIRLSQWGDGERLHHRIEIELPDGDLLCEELLTVNHSTADVRISRDGTLAMFVSHLGHVVGWDLAAAVPSRWEYHLGKSAFTNRLSPDGSSLAIISSERDVHIFDTRTGTRRISLSNIEDYSNCLAWSRDNRRLAVGDQSGMIYVFDAETGEQLWKSKVDFLFARSLCLTADGNRLFVGGFSKEIQIWDWPKNPNSPQVLTGNTATVHDFVLLDSDLKLICGCLDGTIREWSLKNQQMIRQIR